jgi:hypothetical protein
VTSCEEIEPNVFEYYLTYVIVYEGDIEEQSETMGPVTGEWQPGCIPSEALCGDGTCQTHETTSTCPSDCPPNCGDGVCNGGETCASCAADCGECAASCGDGACNGDETCASCAADCGACSYCGDGRCTGGESCELCPADCGECEGVVCGDGICDPGEETYCFLDC